MNRRKMMLLGTTLAMVWGIESVQAASTLPVADENGIVKLTENVTLDNKYLVAADKTITIDLNGFELTGPTTNYAIDNRGNLTIMNGTITCPASTLSYDSSCIRNYKTMNLDTVDVKASWTAVKNEEDSTLQVVKSNLYSEKNTAGVIMNYGNAMVEDSTVNGNTNYKGAAIFALSYAEGENVYSSTITLKNSSIGAYAAVLAKQSNESKGTSATQTVQMKGGVITENSLLEVAQNSTLNVEGDVEAPLAVLPYIAGDTNLTLNSSLVEGDVQIPTLVKKLILKEDATVENVVFQVYSGIEIVNNTSSDIKVVVIDGNNKELTIGAKKIAVISKEDDTNNDVVSDEDENKPANEEVITENKVDNVIAENPKTLDSLVMGFILLVGSLVAVAVASKKVFFKKKFRKIK
ncbi:MAG: hypothetical protein K2M17_05875 [Bacilli bacterium]|nr:hypothetical protein [Bacilli bacterium]